MQLKMSSGKWGPFGLGFNMLMNIEWDCYNIVDVPLILTKHTIRAAKECPVCAGMDRGMGSENERGPYIVTHALFGWADIQNDPRVLLSRCMQHNHNLIRQHGVAKITFFLLVCVYVRTNTHIDEWQANEWLKISVA